ncbi:hypothetical protein MKS88_001800 [Plasmodium brasilianum]|uniref:Uncharacterized protein n=1 Tax=Plasmodium brasilianum TaxID=5824 RepID=A0ACB9YC20_PLABR|nr:hypothetical protein MKS88_001800 [Plasmodium brasilianum]
MGVLSVDAFDKLDKKTKPFLFMFSLLSNGFGLKYKALNALAKTKKTGGSDVLQIRSFTSIGVAHVSKETKILLVVGSVVFEFALSLFIIGIIYTIMKIVKYEKIKRIRIIFYDQKLDFILEDLNNSLNA